MFGTKWRCRGGLPRGQAGSDNSGDIVFPIMKKRRMEIDGILRKLREFENDPRYGDRLYAIEEDLLFLSGKKIGHIILKYARLTVILRVVL